jgi:hypothetical protein
VKLRAILLCSAAAFLAVAPARADRIDAGHGVEAESREFSVGAALPSFELSAFENDPFGTTEVLPSSRSSVSDGFALSPFFRADSGLGFATLTDSHSDPTGSRNGEPARGTRERGRNVNGGSTNIVATPEPESLYLLLIGLCGVGFFACRRGAVVKAAQPGQRLSSGL